MACKWKYKKANVLKDAYNLSCNENTEFLTLGLNIKPINLDTNIYFNKDTNSYEVDKLYIRSQVYKNYYNKRTIESFKVLLNEYFENIELISDLKIDEAIIADKKQFKENIKEAKEEAITTLEKHKNILVGYSNIKKDKINNNLNDYLKINGFDADHIKKNI